MADLGPMSAPFGLDAALAALSGRRILVTGHNGFVGSWLSSLLVRAGAEVVGYSLAPTSGSLGARLPASASLKEVEADVRDLASLRRAVAEFDPEIVFHLAAQALVLESLLAPVPTFEINVIGTANLLEAVRASSVKVCVVVTSDKCYAEGPVAHIESDALGGRDPYSASKAAAELVVGAYRDSFFADGPRVASARAGNIIGGGDAGAARIVPDFLRAVECGTPLVLRHPGAVRPWQHVLDAVSGYVRLAAAMFDAPELATSFNFGPDKLSCVTVFQLVEMLRYSFARATGETPLAPVVAGEPLPERMTLALDSARARLSLGWQPLLDLSSMVDWTIEWHVAARRGDEDTLAAAHDGQIARYLRRDRRRNDVSVPTASASVEAGMLGEHR